MNDRRDEFETWDVDPDLDALLSDADDGFDLRLPHRTFGDEGRLIFDPYDDPLEFEQDVDFESSSGEVAESEAPRDDRTLGKDRTARVRSARATETLAFGPNASNVEDGAVDAARETNDLEETGDDDESEDELEALARLAEGGNVAAQYKLARAYERGVLIPRDLRRAFYWYYLAAKQGFSLARYETGRCYLWGAGTDYDADKAKLHFLRAARQGVAEAQYELGMIYGSEFIGRNSDRRRAIRWLARAARQGLTRAQAALGTLLSKEDDPEKREAGRLWSLRAAKNGATSSRFAPRSLTRKDVQTLKRATGPQLPFESASAARAFEEALETSTDPQETIDNFREDGAYCDDLFYTTDLLACEESRAE